MRIKLKIRRVAAIGTTESSSPEPYWQAYTIEAEEGMSVLEAMLSIFDGEDPTLTFRRSCRSSICGSCAMTINGFPKLACATQLSDEHVDGEDITIEPLANHRVIKDLVVDMTSFWKKIDRVTPYLTPTKNLSKERCPIKKEDEELIDSAQKCIMCASCNAACNALEADKFYIGPAASAKAWRFVGDGREGKSESRLNRLSLTETHGIWDCVRCVHCTQYCPKDARPLEAIERLRARAIERGITDNHGAKHVKSMVASVKRVGRLDEAAMTFKTLGVLRSVGMIPFGLKMGMHGKMPHPIIFPAIDDIDEVRKIYEAVEAKKSKNEREGKE